MAYIIQTICDILIPPSPEEQRIRALTYADLPIDLHSRIHANGSITVLWSYKRPEVRSVIWALKYRKSNHAARLCAQALMEYLSNLDAEAYTWQEQRPLILIPIPLAQRREKERGYNQITMVLKALQKLSPHIQCEPTGLQRIRETVPQTSLARSKRLTNMHGAFRLSPDTLARLKKSRVLIIDDVTTTGSTLLEAARVCKKAGIEIECLALAYAGD